MGLAAFNRMRRRQTEMAEAEALEEITDPDKKDDGDPSKDGQDLNLDKKDGESDLGNTDPAKDLDVGPGNTDLSNPTDYEKMSYEDLKALVKEKNLPCPSVKKVDLIEALKASK